MHTALQLPEIELSVNLGWEDQERVHPQTVLVDLNFNFINPPKACETDTLTDTFCYFELISKLREHISHKEFRLVEYLCKTIYDFILNFLSAYKTHFNLTIQLTKFPTIAGLKKGVRFCYGDK